MVTIILPPEEKIITCKARKPANLKRVSYRRFGRYRIQLGDWIRRIPETSLNNSFQGSWDCVTWFYLFSPYLFILLFCCFIENDWILCNTLNWKHYVQPCYNDTLLETEVVRDLILKGDSLHEVSRPTLISFH